MNTELRLKAKEYARAAHDSIGQKRKYTGEPYWVHTDEVGQILWDAGESDEVVIAGFGHDILEDLSNNIVFGGEPIRFSADDIYHKFGKPVLVLVREVTNEFTTERFPYLNRRIRSECERLRLSSCSPAAMTIKFADVISNISGMAETCPDKMYCLKYIQEKEQLLKVCTKGNKELRDRAFQLIKTSILKLDNMLSDNSRHL